MRHHNSLLHELLQFIPWARFERLVDSHGADRRVRKLSTKSQFIALLHGQLRGTESLRDMTATLNSQQVRLYHLGATAPARSTLADANAQRPAAVFSGLFADLIKQARPELRKAVGEAVHLIDASSIRLSDMSLDWADYKSHGASVKLHTVYEAGTGLPVHFEVTPARVNDITAAKGFDTSPGETYVFDLGYYDFGWWYRLHAAGCRFVTRLKKHTRPEVIETRPVEGDGPVLSERIIRLNRPLRSLGGKTTPLADVPLRELEVVIDTGKKLRLVSNDLEAPAKEIADLYKARWQVELFFRWVKQNLKIKRFIGHSENAIRIQIAVALIAFVLLKLAAAHSPVNSLLTFKRLVSANLMHRRSIKDLHQQSPPQPSFQNQNQLALC